MVVKVGMMETSGMDRQINALDYKRWPARNQTFSLSSSFDAKDLDFMFILFLIRTYQDVHIDNPSKSKKAPRASLG